MSHGCEPAPGQLALLNADGAPFEHLKQPAEEEVNNSPLVEQMGGSLRLFDATQLPEGSVHSLASQALGGDEIARLDARMRDHQEYARDMGTDTDTPERTSAEKVLAHAVYEHISDELLDQLTSRLNLQNEQDRGQTIPGLYDFSSRRNNPAAAIMRARHEQQRRSRPDSH